MKQILRFSVLGVLLVPFALARPHVPPNPQAQLENKVRNELVELPDYGVYDFLAFRLDGHRVTLMGYAENDMLKSEAGKSVSRVKGVEAVQNDIQVLPLSRIDDSIRTALFFRIYHQPSLSRYAAGDGLMMQDPFLRPPLGWQNTPSNTFEPAGDYSIHIIVNNGNVLLLGNVDTKMDKDLAGITANELPGVFKVENLLTVGS